jgi:molecular chaperone HtpG
MSTTIDQHPFQAEVRQLLNIVINSLYTDKEIFVRELVSNASDALEKLRHLQHTEKEIFDEQLGLEIHITTDDTAGTITISDFGIGMTREELVENLGTIAHSGSRKFFQALEESQQKESSLIGQFGVGFYSAFMVADEVKVYTHSWRNEGEHLVWTSDGQSGYTIEEAPGQRRGCKIVAKLRDNCKEFAGASRIEEILKKYSNFVPFPIHLNGQRINTVEALWLKPKAEVKEEDYEEFYKFVSKGWDKPRYQFHFSADAPLRINSLLFVPGSNKEKFLGVGQLEPSVALYCKKVLIDPHPKGLLPEWLRFLCGVIDSADLPLNISRESMQDSQLIQKLNRVVTKRFLKFLDKQAKSDSEKYLEFFKEFSRFLKEGICTDQDHKADLAKLLRFESSLSNAGEMTSLDEYITRMKDGQKEIYYLVGPSRKSIEAGPFLEAFQARGLEVIYLFESIDDYMLGNLSEYAEKKLVPASRADLELGDAVTAEEGASLSEDEVKGLCEFLKEHLGDRVEEVATSSRLVQSPAAALTPEHAMSAQMRRMFQAMNPDGPSHVDVKLEVNPRHDLIKRLAATREANPELAKLVATQLFESSLLAAGLLDSEMPLVNRGYEIMAAALRS